MNEPLRRLAQVSPTIDFQRILQENFEQLRILTHDRLRVNIDTVSSLQTQVTPVLYKQADCIHPLEHHGMVGRCRARGSLNIDCCVLALSQGIVEQPNVAVACGQMEHSDVRAHRLHDASTLVYEVLCECEVLLRRCQEER